MAAKKKSRPKKGKKKSAAKKKKAPARKKAAKRSKKKAPARKKAAKKSAPKKKRKKGRRTVMRSSAGKKLYAVRAADGTFKDIQTYERAHRADLARTGTSNDAGSGGGNDLPPS